MGQTDIKVFDKGLMGITSRSSQEAVSESTISHLQGFAAVLLPLVSYSSLFLLAQSPVSPIYVEVRYAITAYISRQ
jgi:hypothetical protein